MNKSQVLIIGNNSYERSQLLTEFERHNILNSIEFSNDGEEALAKMNFFNKEEDYILYPQIIILNLDNGGLSLVKKLRSDHRYNNFKIYLMAEKESADKIDKKFLFENNVSGLIIKPLKFKDVSNPSYVDSFSLYLDLIKIQKSRR